MKYAQESRKTNALHSAGGQVQGSRHEEHKQD